MRYGRLKVVLLGIIAVLLVAIGFKAIWAPMNIGSPSLVAEASDDSADGEEDTEFC